jgi:hypothetical protein
VEGRLSDMLGSCGVGPSRVNTCDHVWEEARNVSKLQGGGAWTISKHANDGEVEGEIERFAREPRIYVHAARWSMGSPLD